MVQPEVYVLTDSSQEDNGDPAECKKAETRKVPSPKTDAKRKAVDQVEGGHADMTQTCCVVTCLGFCPHARTSLRWPRTGNMAAKQVAEAPTALHGRIQGP